MRSRVISDLLLAVEQVKQHLYALTHRPATLMSFHSGFQMMSKLCSVNRRQRSATICCLQCLWLAQQKQWTLDLGIVLSILWLQLENCV